MAAPHYGNGGTELDAFEDLPFNHLIEAIILKQPKAVVMPAPAHQPDIDELIAIPDLTVQPETEARFLKAPSANKICHNTSEVLASHEAMSIQDYESRGELHAEKNTTTERANKVIKKIPTAVLFTLGKPEKTSTQKLNTKLWTGGAINENVPMGTESPVLRLPRELRDEIYKHLLCKTYHVELPAVGDAALRLGYCANPAYEAAFTPPRRRANFGPTQATYVSPKLENSSDDRAPWSTGPQEQRSYEEKHYSTIQKKRWSLDIPEAYLPILRVSKATYLETRPLLYEKSIFCFLVSEPRKDKLKNSVVGLMKNIHIHLDLSRALERDHSCADQAYTFEFARRLIHRFGGNKIKRKVLIIRIDYPGNNEFLQQPSFILAIRNLTGFETVALGFTPTFMTEEARRSYLTKAHDAVFQSQLDSLHNSHVWNLGLLETQLKLELGPGKMEYTREDFMSMIFHPQSHLTGSRRPEFDIEDLANPRARC